MIVRVPRADDRDHELALLAAWYSDAEASVSSASPLPWLWLGAQEAWWAWEGKARGPVLIEARRLRDRWSSRGRRRGDAPRYQPRPATVPVFVDSGAFSEVSTCGAWTWPAADFVAFIRQVIAALGAVRHVGIQDWMCEPEILARTGLDVAEHQRRTVRSFVELRELAPEVPWLPTLQGFTASDYQRCADLYEAEGVVLADELLVGLGSVCRRSGTAELVAVIMALQDRRLALHGYGVKSEGALLSCAELRSCDSAAWSQRARFAERDIRAALFGPGSASRTVAEVAEAIMVRGERLDLDMLDWWRWKQEHSPRGAQNSQDFAEWWRAQQQMRLVVAAQEQAAALWREVRPGQRDMFDGQNAGRPR